MSKSSERKTIPKKVRFEVFKRDSFTCQYCGQCAPDVILNADHIKPVSKGGDDSIVNLITACRDCNSGKTNVELDDSAALNRQKAQLDDLNERREQLKLMMEWRESLKAIDDDAVAALVKEMDKAMVSRHINETGEASVRKWYKKYGYTLISECIEASSEQYLRFDDEGNCVDESAHKFFEMIPRIAANKQKFGDDPDMASLYYARGILRKRLNYCDDQKAINWLKHAHGVTGDAQELVELAKQVKNWTKFREAINQIVEEAE